MFWIILITIITTIVCIAVFSGVLIHISIQKAKIRKQIQGLADNSLEMFYYFVSNV